MERVTVVVRDDVVLVRGRDAEGRIVAEAAVPRAEMTDAHVQAMRQRDSRPTPDPRRPRPEPTTRALG